MTVLVTLTLAGTDVGPFNLYSNVDGYTTPLATGVSRAALVAGYNLTGVPDTATVIRATSTGTCTNFLDMILSGGTTSTTTTTIIPPTTSTTSTTTTTTFVTFSLTYSASSGATACSDFLLPTNRNFYYAAPGATLTIGTILYTTSTLTTPVPNGYYSNGADYWETAASVGNLQNQTNCNP